MSALQTEYNEAVEEGVEFLWETTVTEFIGSNGKLEKIRVKTPEGENFMPIDRILLAIGSRPANRIVSTTSGIEVDRTQDMSLPKNALPAERLPEKVYLQAVMSYTLRKPSFWQ